MTRSGVIFATHHKNDLTDGFHDKNLPVLDAWLTPAFAHHSKPETRNPKLFTTGERPA
jgi:hypothetical protein